MARPRARPPLRARPLPKKEWALAKVWLSYCVPTFPFRYAACLVSFTKPLCCVMNPPPPPPHTQLECT